MRSIAAPVLALTILCTGCATVSQGTTHSLRIETLTAQGQQLDGADCTLTNDQGTTIAKSGSSTRVRRSSKDLEVSCAAPGQTDARGRLVSRANIGLVGNVIIGGVAGAIIDHNTGAAYTYPGWVRLVFGEFNVFDRGDERDGVAMASPDAPRVQGAATNLQGQGAAPVQPVAVVRGDTFDYRVTDRISGRSATVVLRAELVEGGQVIFNGGSRVESVHGGVIRLNSAIVGEMDQVTPPGGWLQDGRIPTGQWKMRHRSVVPASRLSYELDASTEGEEKLRIDGREVRAVRIALRGWVENHSSGQVIARGAYEGVAWISPELRRVVRFEARARASGRSGAGYFHVDEVTELMRIGRD